MKLLITIILTFALASIGLAQQEYQYTLNMFNGYVYNPAVASSKPSSSLTGITRSQWSGFDGAPKTSNITFTSPLPKNLGIGGYILGDRFGDFNRTVFNLGLSYALKLSDLRKLSFGLSTNFSSLNLNTTNFKFIDAGDPGIAINPANVTQSRVQTNFGLLYSTNSLYLGLSGINILPSNRSSASYTLNSSRLLTLTAGYNYKLNDNWDVRPSVFAKLGGQESKYLAIDIAIIGFLKQKYISGIGYRVGDAISLCLGYSISPNLKFIYSYGYSVNRLSSVNNGTHEILFGYDWPLNISRFNNNIIKSPRFL